MKVALIGQTDRLGFLFSNHPANLVAGGDQAGDYGGVAGDIFALHRKGLITLDHFVLPFKAFQAGNQVGIE